MGDLTEVHELQIAVEDLRRHLSIISIETLAEIEKMQKQIELLLIATSGKPTS